MAVTVEGLVEQAVGLYGSAAAAEAALIEDVETFLLRG